MEEQHAMKDSAVIDVAAAPGASRSQTLVAGGVTLILCMALWGTWVFLIGARPCALSYLWWR